MTQIIPSSSTKKYDLQQLPSFCKTIIHACSQMT